MQPRRPPPPAALPVTNPIRAPRARDLRRRPAQPPSARPRRRPRPPPRRRPRAPPRRRVAAVYRARPPLPLPATLPLLLLTPCSFSLPHQERRRAIDREAAGLEEPRRPTSSASRLHAGDEIRQPRRHPCPSRAPLAPP